MMQQRLINDCSITNYDNQNSLKYYLNALPEEEREQAANLTYLALSLPDGSKTLEDYSAWHFLGHLRAIPTEDRETVQALSRKIYLAQMHVFDRIKISKAIHNIPQQDRQDVIARSLSLADFDNPIKSFANDYVNTNIFSNAVDAFVRVPIYERQSLIDQSRLLSTDYIEHGLLTHYMYLLANVDKEHRLVIVESAKKFGYAKDMYLVHILEVITKVLPEDLNQVLNYSIKCMNSFLNKILTEDEKETNKKGLYSYYTCHVSDYCYPLLIRYFASLSSDARFDFFNTFNNSLNKEEENLQATEEEKSNARYRCKSRICDMLFYLNHPKM